MEQWVKNYKRLKKLRGLRIPDVARLISEATGHSITINTVESWTERGYKGYPQAINALGLSLALGVSPYELFGIDASKNNIEPQGPRENLRDENIRLEDSAGELTEALLIVADAIRSLSRAGDRRAAKSHVGSAVRSNTQQKRGKAPRHKR